MEKITTSATQEDNLHSRSDPESIPEQVLASSSDEEGNKIQGARYLVSSPNVLSVLDVKWHFPDILCTTTDTAWVRTKRLRLERIDYRGDVKESIAIDFMFCGIALTMEGDILLPDRDGRCIKMISKDRRITSLFKTERKPYGICCLQNGDFLVILRMTSHYRRIVKYDRAGAIVKEVDRVLNIKEPGSITVNKVNNDVYIRESRKGRRKIVVLDQDLKLRYEYKGIDGERFDPLKVCTDNIGNVLITDRDNNKLHILDKDGRFMKYLCASELGVCLQLPKSIAVDKEGNVWIGREVRDTGRGSITVIKFI